MVVLTAKAYDGPQRGGDGKGGRPPTTSVVRCTGTTFMNQKIVTFTNTTRHMIADSAKRTVTTLMTTNTVKFTSTTRPMIADSETCIVIALMITKT
eukprot:6096935-Pyramimonas_sp.AAC.1